MSSNIFGLADDIQIVGYDADSREHDRTQDRWCRYAIEKTLNKNKYHFSYQITIIWGDNVQRRGTARPQEAACTNRSVPY